MIFGPEDRFLNLFAELMRFAPVMPLARADARFQPVYVGDVAECIVRALALDETIGHKYPLCGPKIYTLRELVRYVGETIGAVRPIVPLGRKLATLQALVLEQPAGDADEPRQPGVDAEGQRLRVRISAGIRLRAAAARDDRPDVPRARGDAEPLRRIPRARPSLKPARFPLGHCARRREPLTCAHGTSVRAFRIR